MRILPTTSIQLASAPLVSASIPSRDATQAPSTDIDEQPEVEEPAPDKRKGVLRNLLEGHFRGVADVRLRINFHDELSRLGATPAREPVEAETPTQVVGDVIEIPVETEPSEGGTTAGDEEQQSLPLLSEPKGNGVAYAKFLAIYLELQSPATTGIERQASLDLNA